MTPITSPFMIEMANTLRSFFSQPGGCEKK
jgi:hypothetical protein